MGKLISISQSHQLISVVANNVDWNALDSEAVQRFIEDPKGSGMAFTRFLQCGGRVAPLTHTTFGPEIPPPFKGAILVEDGPGDERLEISNLELIPVLKEGDGDYISFEEAVNRSRANPETNWGQRAAFALRDAGRAKKIPESIWPVGCYVICGKTVWRHRFDVGRVGWYVIRDVRGFSCVYDWFTRGVDSGGRLLRLCK